MWEGKLHSGLEETLTWIFIYDNDTQHTLAINNIYGQGRALQEVSDA
jgi:hypothetical protein